MKKITLSLILIALSISVFSQENLDEGYYVTIGVYAKSKEVYAKKYAEKATSMGYEAAYGYNPSRNYYYVFTTYSRNFQEALNDMRSLRKVEEFDEAWVYVHMATMNTSVPLTKVEKEEVEKKDEALKKAVTQDLSQAYAEKFKNVDSTSSNTDETLITEEEAELEGETEETDVAPKTLESLNNIEVEFIMVNARNMEPVDGKIQVIDAERSKLLEVVDANTRVKLPDPNNRTGRLILISDRFGYRKTQKEIHYYSPMLDSAREDIYIDEAYSVVFDMIRYHKGDIATMFNVYFYKDAAIMTPESRYEVEQLLEMMRENDHYRIKIHGHTNGNRAGKIITRHDDQEYFALNDNNTEGYGSAKKLSEERAKEIKDFLIANGISKDRMEIKAWGGKRMVHEKNTNKARYNVRVEIEIIEE
ncbi:MAG: OmpA family protein [Fulvivirga sp.]